MNLADIVVLAVVITIGYQFWRIRAISESARVYLRDYCKKQGLQLISVARSKTKITFYKSKLDWYSEFEFEFSGNGEDACTGQLVMKGLTVMDTHLPAYRI